MNKYEVYTKENTEDDTNENKITISTSVDIGVDGVCVQCKGYLKLSLLSLYGALLFVEVKPCRRCMLAERKEGYEEGYNERKYNECQD